MSNTIHTRNQTRVIESFHDSINNTDDDFINEVIKAAIQYNKELINNPHRFFPTQEELDHYHSLLKTKNNTNINMIGTLEVPKLNMILPIYLGTNENTLKIGLGHIEGTSLPVGGIGTHTVITGHRGLHTARLLTDIDKMQIGDVFTLNILNQTKHYITDQIIIVLPDEYENLAIDPNKDYATLLTCTPIGVNTHRLLVRGERVQDENVPILISSTEDYQIDVEILTQLILTILLIIILAIIMILITRLIKNKKPKGNKNAISNSRKTKRRKQYR